MARDFEDLHELDDLSDDELRGLVRDHLAAHNALDIDDLTIRVQDGLVILEGRVGTDGERLIAEHVVRIWGARRSARMTSSSIRRGAHSAPKPSTSTWWTRTVARACSSAIGPCR